MGGIHIRVAYPQRCVGLCRHQCLFLQGYGLNKRRAEDGGGAASLSTVKGKTEMVKFFKEMKCFSLLPHDGPGDAPKGVSPGLGGGADPFFLCRIVLPKR